jgi:hypothetical protein
MCDLLKEFGGTRVGMRRLGPRVHIWNAFVPGERGLRHGAHDDNAAYVEQGHLQVETRLLCKPCLDLPHRHSIVLIRSHLQHVPPACGPLRHTKRILTYLLFNFKLSYLIRGSVVG